LFVKHPFDPTCTFTIIRLYCDQIGPRVHWRRQWQILFCWVQSGAFVDETWCHVTSHCRVELRGYTLTLSTKSIHRKISNLSKPKLFPHWWSNHLYSIRIKYFRIPWVYKFKSPPPFYISMPPRSISGVTPPMSGRGEGGDPGDRAAFYAGSMGTISGSLGSRNP
jgi:hypothetical protein